jgi:hypothetical protein
VFWPAFGGIFSVVLIFLMDLTLLLVLPWPWWEWGREATMRLHDLRQAHPSCENVAQPAG